MSGVNLFLNQYVKAEDKSEIVMFPPFTSVEDIANLVNLFLIRGNFDYR